MSWIKTKEGNYVHTDLVTCVVKEYPQNDIDHCEIWFDNENIVGTAMSPDEVMELIREAERSQK